MSGVEVQERGRRGGTGGPGSPVLVRTREELAAARADLPGPVAVVMTMGALHAGHVELVRRARESARSVVVTIFVNPLQFGPSEDLARYPRDLDRDLALLAEHGADVVFAPTREVMYPGGDPLVRVSAGALGEVLEGASRPGHLDGVLTVVAKLMHLVRPDLAMFGQKDAQQLACVRRMVRDLDMGVDVVAVPTVREADGLALSSRNAYLSPHERTAALALSRALQAGADRAGEGAQAVLAAAGEVLDAEPGCDLDYLVVVDPDTLAGVRASDEEEPGAGPRTALLAVAARVGPTRLIDNVLVDLTP